MNLIKGEQEPQSDLGFSLGHLRSAQMASALCGAGGVPSTLPLLGQLGGEGGGGRAGRPPASLLVLALCHLLSCLAPRVDCSPEPLCRPLVCPRVSSLCPCSSHPPAPSILQGGLGSSPPLPHGALADRLTGPPEGERGSRGQCPLGQDRLSTPAPSPPGT